MLQCKKPALGGIFVERMLSDEMPAASRQSKNMIIRHVDMRSNGRSSASFATTSDFAFTETALRAKVENKPPASPVEIAPQFSIYTTCRRVELTLRKRHSMAKSREKVQQLGFWDTEVSRPDHDAVCLWAYENAESMLRAACPSIFDCAWDTREIATISPRLGTDVFAQARAFIEKTVRPNPRVVARTLEYVLLSHTGHQGQLERIVGYADVLVETEIPSVTPKYVPSSPPSGEDVFDGFEITWTKNGAPRVLVEAKAELPTVGELMRQIQLYRTAFRGHFVVVSPDSSYADILSEQGVTFVKYPL